MRRKTFLLNLFLVFLLGFGFIYVCYVGLPYDFSADHPQNIHGVELVNYGELVKLVIDPRTPVWFYPPGNRADFMAYVRPLQFLLIKIYYAFSGYSLPYIHTIAAIGCGILMAFFFSFVAYWTGSTLLGWLTVMLYLSFPSNFFMLFTVFVEDSQFFLSIFSISALLLFGCLTSQKMKSGLLGFKWALWVIFIWLAIKLKSTEKILPIACLAFLVWQFRSIRAMTGLRRIIILAFTIVGMSLLIVPSQTSFHHFSQKIRRANTVANSGDISLSMAKDKKALSFKWQNALKRTFYASNEKFSLRSLYHREKNPLSFTENYGFLLGSLFWMGLFFSLLFWAGFKTRYPLPDGLPHRELFPHFFKLLLVWFGAVLAGFSSGMDLTENRFLNFAYVPSVLLLFMMIGAFLKYLAGSVAKFRLVRILIILLISGTVLSNFIVFSKLLGFYGGRGAALVRAEKDIFPIVYGKNPDARNLYEKHPDLERRAVTVSWYEYPKDWTEIAQEKLRYEKTVFLYLKTPDVARLNRLRESGIEVDLWKRYGFLDAEPLLFRFLKKLYSFKKTGRNDPSTELFVYRLQRSAAGTSQGHLLAENRSNLAQTTSTLPAQ